MTDKLTCISPIDGSIFAQRQTLSLDAARDVNARARATQPEWEQQDFDTKVTDYEVARGFKRA